MTPQAFLTAVIAQKEAGRGDIQDCMVNVFGGGKDLPTANQEAVVIDPGKAKERYFVVKPGSLEHAALPYRTERSLSDGLSDIEQLAGAQETRGEVLAEGSWIFDPQTQVWYSLGGETKWLGSSNVKHTSLPYDIGQLSSEPVSVHIHPQKFVPIAGEKIGFAFPSNADYRTVATMIETSGSEIRPRSLIVHPLGITEFTYPNDAEQIRQMGEVAEAIKEQAFAQFGSLDALQAQADSMGERQFTQQLMDQINVALPEGFRFRIYPHGANLTERG
jgi:hypothetical protein